MQPLRSFIGPSYYFASPYLEFQLIWSSARFCYLHLLNCKNIMNDLSNNIFTIRILPCEITYNVSCAFYLELGLCFDLVKWWTQCASISIMYQVACIPVFFVQMPSIRWNQFMDLCCMFHQKIKCCIILRCTILGFSSFSESSFRSGHGINSCLQSVIYWQVSAFIIQHSCNLNWMR